MTTDLLGDKLSPAKHPNAKPEAACLTEVLMALRAHPSVAWAERMNSGVARVGGRFVRFGFVGLSDVLAQLHDGRILCVEVKAPGGKLSPEQADFIERVNFAGGCAFLARNCADVFKHLGKP